MRHSLARVLTGLLVVGGLAAVWVIPRVQAAQGGAGAGSARSFANAPQVPGTVPQPGMAPARVWINNQKREEAIPVTIVYADPSDVAMPVKIQGAAAVTVNGPVATTRNRQAWEYRVVSAASDQELAAAMNSAGSDGWEAVGVTSQPGAKITAVLKRPR
jgi:hypothetical protein